MCVTWLVCMCDVTHSWVWHKSFISVTWFIHMRAMNSASSLLPSAKFSELNFTVLLYSKLRSELTFENLYMPPAMLLKLHTCNTLQHTATYCNILKYTATHCSNTLPHTATQCNTLQHTTTRCDTLKHTATHCNTLKYAATQCSNILPHTATHWNTPQHSATHCNKLEHTATHNTLRHTAIHRSTLQHTATHCNTLPAAGAAAAVASAMLSEIVAVVRYF